MIIAILIWTLLVAGIWWFADVVVAFITPGSAWLAANPDLATWIEPTLGFVGTLGTAAAVIAWLAGVVLILLFSRGRRAVSMRRALSYEDWQREDGGAPPPRGGWRSRPYPSRGYDDDGDRDRGRYRRRRRDDDDDDDDDD